MAAPPTAEQMEALLAQWSDWLAGRTDTMLSLEDRVRSAGSADDEADLAAAFVARKAVADRLQAIAELAEHTLQQAAALAGRPLTDNLGGPVGQNLADAAALVDGIVTRVEQRVSEVEQRLSAEVSSATQADLDLSVAERLAAEFGSHVNQAAQLRSALIARHDLAGVARRAAELRGELEQLASERRQLLERWAKLDERLDRLSAVEASTRKLAQRCREKVLHAPALAVPAVEALGQLPSSADVASMPWLAARAAIAPVLDRVERLEAALSEAHRRYQQPLDDRDNLRGLLHSFRAKADAHGFGESADIEPLYRQAESLLWAAPCDLVAATPLVDRYVAAVNAAIAAAVSRGGVAG